MKVKKYLCGLNFKSVGGAFFRRGTEFLREANTFTCINIVSVALLKLHVKLNIVFVFLNKF